MQAEKCTPALWPMNLQLLTKHLLYARLWDELKESALHRVAPSTNIASGDVYMIIVTKVISATMTSLFILFTQHSSSFYFVLGAGLGTEDIVEGSKQIYPTS